MLSCWEYIPENRIHFSDILTHLKQMLLDKNREQPTTWFSNELSSQTVRKQKGTIIYIFLVSYSKGS